MYHSDRKYFPGGLAYVDGSTGGKHLFYDMLQREDGVFVLNFPSLLMLDYDMPSDRHLVDSALAGASLSDLLARLANSGPIFAQYGLPPDATWRVHQTAGGFHAFRMDIAVPPDPLMADLLEAIGCDAGYASLMRNTETWPIRVSKKRVDEPYMYKVIHTTFGGDSVCEECRLQMVIYEQMVSKYDNH